MSRKNLLACILTLSVLALAAPLPAQAAPPATTPASTTSPVRRQPGQPAITTRPATSDAGGSASQGDTTQPAPRGGGGGLTDMLGSWPFLLIIGMVVLMLVMSSRTRRRQQKKQGEMLSGMKKGDRVTTIGGLIGTLIEVRENEVVIKVDEQNNTRMRFLKSAVHHVGDAASAVAAEKEKGK